MLSCSLLSGSLDDTPVLSQPPNDSPKQSTNEPAVELLATAEKVEVPVLTLTLSPPNTQDSQ